MQIKLTTLSENTAGRPGLLAEWGLSILIEVDGYKVLLDTGAGISATQNAAFMGIDLSQIDKIVISHGHQDHTGGLRHVLEVTRKEIEVVAHPDIWTSKYVRATNERERYTGIPFSREALESLGAYFSLDTKPVWLNENIVTTGEISMHTEYERIDSQLYVKEGGQLHADPLRDDLALMLKTKKGLIVILGCGHRGMINTLHHAQKLTGVEHIHMVIGGTHLITASREQLDLTVAELKQIGVDRIGVSHCTGLPAASIMLQEFGQSFFFNNAGRRIDIEA